MKPEYYPRTLVQKLGKLVEECGEVQAAVGKTFRWGLESTNPELPPEQQETNRDWILRELDDLEEAVDIVKQELLTFSPMPERPTIKCDQDDCPGHSDPEERPCRYEGPQYPRATCERCSGCGYTVQPSYSGEWEHDCSDCLKPRPPYVPESAPFCWSVDGLGEEVAMWVNDRQVKIYHPDQPSMPWGGDHRKSSRERWENEPSPRLSARLWDDADGLWRKVRGE